MLAGSRSVNRKVALLTAYANCGGVRRACEIAGVDTPLHYVWLQRDPNYKLAFDKAFEMAGDTLEQAAYERATKGVVKDVWHQGKIVGQEVVYSDGLTKFLLKGAKPARYRDNVDITTAGQSLRIVIDGYDDSAAQDAILLAPPNSVNVSNDSVSDAEE
jgi:hypothetical protein